MMKTLLVGGLGLGIITLGGAPAFGQAWSGERGELSLSSTTAYQTSSGVYFGDSGLISGLGADSMRETLGVEYTPIEHLTFGVRLTGQSDRYSGKQSGGGGFVLAHGSQDDGDWHGNITDLDLDARYQLYDGAIAVSPVVRGKIPVTDYEVQGYAGAGTGLWEIGVGAYVGKMGLGLEHLFVQAGYTYNVVEKYKGGGPLAEDFNTNYSDASLAVGYAISERFSVFAGPELRWAHGGFETSDYNDLDDTGDEGELKHHHDPVLKRQFVALDAGVDFQISDAFSVGLVGGMILWGDSVSDAKLVGLELGWDLDTAGGG
jgi:hypothetical protein